MNVALIVFNRPRHTEQVFRQIAAARPERLFVIADGPRPGVVDDEARVAAARDVTESVDWPCEVLRNYAAVNLGCGIRPATGISWVFDHVEDCIILEDDCVPVPSFFPYCQEMLNRYREIPAVMMVSGNQFQRHKVRTRFSYVFSRYPLTWGWGTWRRAWSTFDHTMTEWPNLRGTSWLADRLGSKEAAAFWAGWFDRAQGDRQRDIWDVMWAYAIFRHAGLCIHPATNLVKNTGFGLDSTHTREAASFAVGAAIRPMRFPLRHPACIQPDGRYERRLLDSVFLSKPRLRDVLANRHTYGAWLRRIPWIGHLWGRWRQSGEGAQGKV